MRLANYFYDVATDKESGCIAVFVKIGLFITSIAYGVIIRALIFLQSLWRHQLGCKVISVGNITWGGTGKTPLVESIARYLKQRGRKVAILSRGYKRKTVDCRLSTVDYKNVGDEPAMLMNNLEDVPVIVDANRIRSAKKAIKEYAADTVLLDDGFQQWKIKKDLEIVAIDAVCPFGNRHMIPRGILREPLSSLKRADMFVFTKTNLNPDIQKAKDFLHSLNPQAAIFESIHKPKGFYDITKLQELLSLDLLQGKIVTSLCALAAPDSFEGLIKELGASVGLSFRFSDHYAYQKNDIDEVIRQSKDKGITIIVTTEKDAVRIPREAIASDVSVLALKIELTITGNEEEFYNRI